MEVVNPFILKNKSRMIKYIDELATLPNGTLDNSHSMEPDLIIKGQPDRELANILSICESHLHLIQGQAHNRVCYLLGGLKRLCSFFVISFDFGNYSCNCGEIFFKEMKKTNT